MVHAPSRVIGRVLSGGPVNARGHVSVLVVDDDQRMQRACAEAFSTTGFELRFADSGEVALADVRRRAPHVLVTELFLPGMDGLTLLRQARREAPSMAAIVMTDRPSSSAAARALRLGADDFVIKHVDSVAHLRSSVRNALRRHSHQTETARLLVELAELNEHFLQAMQQLQVENMGLVDRYQTTDKVREGFRVLVVDDDATIVAVLESLLRSQPGVDVTGVTSVTDAREQVKGQSFDMVITDMHLEDGNGIDLMTTVQAHAPGTAVILMTGYATLESAIAAVRGGAIAYLQKPFTDLNVVLGHVLDVKERLERDRKQDAYQSAFRSRNADFLARYRLIKTKLVTLQREST